jgi:hypothetical protein
MGSIVIVKGAYVTYQIFILVNAGDFLVWVLGELTDAGPQSGAGTSGTTRE